MNQPTLDTPRFNLVEEPWIRVRTSDGETRLLGLAAVFAGAGRLARIEGDLPTQDFAVLRLLLAVLRRAIGWPGDPQVDDVLVWWQELWQAPELPGEVQEYLAHCRDSFYLFGGERPFYQVPGLQYDKAGRGPDSMSAVVPDVNPERPWFAQRDAAGCSSLPAAVAARWLVHLQAFDVSGIKTATAGDPSAKGGKSYPIGTGWAGALGGIYVQGPTLRETLLLNLAPGQPAGSVAADRPAWERPVDAPGAVPREPWGPVDVLTWQSRRVRLLGDSAGERAVGVVLSNGMRLTTPNRHGVEYLTQWRRSAEQEKKLRLPMVIMPRRLDPGRALWRGLPAVLGSGGQGQAPPPGCVAGVELLAGHEVLPADFRVQIVAAGLAYGTQDAVITDAMFDVLDFAVGAIRDPEHVQLVARAAEAADLAARAVGDFAKDLHASSGGHADHAAAARDGARGRAFASLDPLFRGWLAGFGAEPVGGAEAAWQRVVFGAARRLASDMLAEAPDSAWIGVPDSADPANPQRWRSAPRAEARLLFALRKQLPLAYPEEDAR